jgi:hypothetical protein
METMCFKEEENEREKEIKERDLVRMPMELKKCTEV